MSRFMNPKISVKQVGRILILTGLLAGVFYQPQSDPATASGRGERFGKGAAMLSMIIIGAAMVAVDLLSPRSKPPTDTTGTAAPERAPRSSAVRILLLLIAVLAGGAAGLFVGGYGYSLCNPLPTRHPRVGEKFRAVPAMQRPQERLTWMTIGTLLGGGLGFATALVGAVIASRRPSPIGNDLPK